MELEGLEARRKGRLMAALSMVFTARYAASYLRVDVEVIEELAEQMAPEDGRLSVIDSLDERAESVTAFTRQVSNISTTSSMIAGHSSCETSQPAAAFAGWIRDEDGLRRTFRHVHRHYTGYINARMRVTGHLWQGRFSSVAMDEAHSSAPCAMSP